MSRFQPIAFVAFLPTGFPFFALSLFWAFLRTAGLRLFQTVGGGRLAAVAAVLSELFFQGLDAFPQVFRACVSLTQGFDNGFGPGTIDWQRFFTMVFRHQPLEKLDNLHSFLSFHDRRQRFRGQHNDRKGALS